jgi:hypothetical protein
MACYDTSPWICSYDSKVAAGKDYSSLATWESASDNDLVTGTDTPFLDCFDSQVHDDSHQYINGATVSTTYYRTIRSAAGAGPLGCATLFAGKDGTGANFVRSTGTDGYLINITEGFFRLESICASYTASKAAAVSVIYVAVDDAKVINVVAFNCVNGDATNVCDAFTLKESNNICFNCIAYGTDRHAFVDSIGAGETSGFVSCTAVNNGGYGFYDPGVGGDALAWNCYGANNTTADYSTGMTGGWCAAKDTNADNVNGTNYKNSIDLTDTEMDADFLALTSMDWAAGAGENAGRNPNNDFTAVWNPDSFLTGGGLAALDIAGKTRPSGVDAAWDVGASEYVAAGGLSIPIAMYHYMHNLKR